MNNQQVKVVYLFSIKLTSINLLRLNFLDLWCSEHLVISYLCHLLKPSFSEDIICIIIHQDIRWFDVQMCW